MLLKLVDEVVWAGLLEVCPILNLQLMLLGIVDIQYVLAVYQNTTAPVCHMIVGRFKSKSHDSHVRVKSVI